MSETKQFSKTELIDEWERIQNKTFVNWINSHLCKRNLKVENLLEDLKDGINLANLLEIISDDPLPKINRSPKLRIHQIENIGKCLQFITDHDVKLASIGAEDIVDGNVKLTLGLMWTLILRFVVVGLNEEGVSAKEGLLLWCRRKTQKYDNVNIKDFTMSWQDGIAMCAIIHRHRPDLIDIASLKPEDKIQNLNKAFSVAHEQLGVAKLLDAEDIVNMPKPDERSILTYVAQLYTVFASMDKIEVAGRRVGKFVDFQRSVSEMTQEYEQKALKFTKEISDEVEALSHASTATDYDSYKELLADFIAMKEKGRGVTKQLNELSSLYGQIQTKLQSINRPAYVPPSGQHPDDIAASVEKLRAAERTRKGSLNSSLHATLEELRKVFAKIANDFWDELVSIKSVLRSTDSLESQLEATKKSQERLVPIKSTLSEIEDAENACGSANIVENEYCDHTLEDLQFEYEQVVKALQKRVVFLNSQIAAQSELGVSPEKLAEFKETFHHFDADTDNLLSRLEFKACLSGLGVIELDFEGTDDEQFGQIFQEASGGAESVNFDQFVKFMVDYSSDRISPKQLFKAFDTMSGDKDFVTEADMKSGGLTSAEISHLIKELPAKGDGYDYDAWLKVKFKRRD